jgi:hypothetical protein
MEQWTPKKYKDFDITQLSEHEKEYLRIRDGLIKYREYDLADEMWREFRYSDPGVNMDLTPYSLVLDKFVQDAIAFEPTKQQHFAQIKFVRDQFEVLDPEIAHEMRENWLSRRNYYFELKEDVLRSIEDLKPFIEELRRRRPPNNGNTGA